MHHVVVLVEDHVGAQPAELALEGEQVVGQRQDGDGVPEAAQAARDVADLGAQVRGAATVLRGPRAGLRYKRCRRVRCAGAS